MTKSDMKIATQLMTEHTTFRDFCTALYEKLAREHDYDETECRYNEITEFMIDVMDFGRRREQ